MKKATLVLLLCWSVFAVSCKKDSQGNGDESLASLRTKIVGLWASKSVTRISLDASGKELKRETFDYLDVQEYSFDGKIMDAVKGNLPNPTEYAFRESNGKIIMRLGNQNDYEVRMNNGSFYWTSDVNVINGGDVVKFVNIAEYQKK